MITLKSLVILIFTTNLCLADNLESLKYFRQSIEEIQAGFAFAKKITKMQGSVGTISKEQRDKIINYSKKALEYSNKVLDKDLNKIDKSLFYKTLAKNYENLFREGLRLHILGIEKGDPLIGIKANRLVNKWGAYYRKKFNLN